MATTRPKGTQLRNALSELLTALQQHGAVDITARVAGTSFTISLSDTTGAPRGRGSVGEGLPSGDAVIDLLRKNTLGLRLKELAAHFGVKPRNRLKPLIAQLSTAGRLKAAGRRFRASDVVVRRGRKPVAAAATRVPKATRRGRHARRAKRS